MDFTSLIDELEDMVDAAPKMPLTNKCILDREEIWEVIQQIRLNYPEEMKQASWVKKERERIINEAHQEAASIVENGKTEVIKMVNETEILRIAKQKSQEIVEDADTKARTIVLSAQDNAKDTMNDANKKAKELEQQAFKYIDSLLENVSKVTNSARDSICTSFSELNNRYAEIDSVLEKLTASRQMLNNRKD